MAGLQGLHAIAVLGHQFQFCSVLARQEEAGKMERIQGTKRTLGTDRRSQFANGIRDLEHDAPPEKCPDVCLDLCLPRRFHLTRFIGRPESQQGA